MEKIAIKSQRSGRTKMVGQRLAARLIGRGWTYAARPAPEVEPEPVAPTEKDIEDLSYNELRTIAADLGVEPEGRKKADYVEALRYNRRDMRAED